MKCKECINYTLVYNPISSKIVIEKCNKNKKDIDKDVVCDDFISDKTNLYKRSI